MARRGGIGDEIARALRLSFSRMQVRPQPRKPRRKAAAPPRLATAVKKRRPPARAARVAPKRAPVHSFDAPTSGPGLARCGTARGKSILITGRTDKVTCIECLRLMVEDKLSGAARAPAFDPAPDPSKAEGPDWNARQRLDLQGLEPFVASLTGDFRAVVEAILAGKGATEIAHELSLTRGAVYSRCWQARKKLRRLEYLAREAERGGLVVPPTEVQPTLKPVDPPAPDLPTNEPAKQEQPAAPAPPAETSAQTDPCPRPKRRPGSWFQAMHAHLDRLSPRQQQLVNLLVAGRSIKEAAAELGVTLGTAYSMNQQARTRLEALTAHDEDEDGDPEPAEEAPVEAAAAEIEPPAAAAPARPIWDQDDSDEDFTDVEFAAEPAPEEAPELPAAAVAVTPPHEVDLDGEPASPAVEKARVRLRVINDRVRAKTIAPNRLSRDERREAELLVYPPDVDRPLTRDACESMPRPCPFVSCSHHLYLDVNPESGAIKLNFPHLEVHEMPETCSLDVADRGGITLEEVGAILNLTRERIRQVETRGLHKIKDHSGGELGIAPERGTSPAQSAIDS